MVFASRWSSLFGMKFPKKTADLKVERAGSNTVTIFSDVTGNGVQDSSWESDLGILRPGKGDGFAGSWVVGNFLAEWKKKQSLVQSQKKKQISVYDLMLKTDP